MSTQERIKQDAIQIAKDELYNSKPYPSWEDLIEKGALSERNRTIEEIREEIEKMQNECTDNGEYVVLEQLKEKLDSLTPKK